MKKNEKYVKQGLALVTHFFACEGSWSSRLWRDQFQKQYPHPQAERTTETIASDLLGAFVQFGIVTKQSQSYTVLQWPRFSSIDEVVKAYMKKKNPGRHLSQVTPLPNMDAESLAPHPLKKILKGCDITQGSLAKTLGVKRAQVSRWLNNIEEMPAGVEARIKRALGINPPPSADRQEG